jgi:hypothetical protein
LASDAEFEQNMQSFSAAKDSWTQHITTFGSGRMNNHGCEAQKNPQKVGGHKSILDSVSVNRIYLFHHVFMMGILYRLKLKFTKNGPNHTTLLPNSQIPAGMFYVCCGPK